MSEEFAIESTVKSAYALGIRAFQSGFNLSSCPFSRRQRELSRAFKSGFDSVWISDSGI